jgi:hypothetical protein
MPRQLAFLTLMLWMTGHAVAPAFAQTRAAEEVVILGAAPEDAQSVAPKVGAKPASVRGEGGRSEPRLSIDKSRK